jgi:hypothetical protein|eukprot:3960455-Prymnesium_polylepis.1
MLSKASERLLAPASAPVRAMASSAGRVRSAPRLRRPPKEVMQLVRLAPRFELLAVVSVCSAARRSLEPVPARELRRAALPVPACGYLALCPCTPARSLIRCGGPPDMARRLRLQPSASAACSPGGKSRTSRCKRCALASKHAAATACRTRWTTPPTKRSSRRRSTSTVSGWPLLGEFASSRHLSRPTERASALSVFRGTGVRRVVGADAHHRHDDGLCRGAPPPCTAPPRCPAPSILRPRGRLKVGPSSLFRLRMI